MTAVGSALLPMPRAIVFDWDNTLVDTWPSIHAAMKSTFEAYGMKPWTVEETKQRVSHSLKDSFPQLFGEHWEEAGKAYQAHYRANHLERLVALPRAKEVLEYLQLKGVVCALVSNKRGDTLRKEVEYLRWGKFFVSEIGSGDAERDKPHPEPLHMALEGTDITVGADVWFIGDTVSDIEIAANTGCTALLYGDAQPKKQADGSLRFQGFPVAHHSPDHADFVALLHRVLG